MILFVGPYNIISSPNKSTGGIDSHSRITIQNFSSLNKRTLVVCWEAQLKRIQIVKNEGVIFVVLPKQKSLLGFLYFLILLRLTVYHLSKKKKIEAIVIQSISYILLSQHRSVCDKALVFVHGIMCREYKPKLNGSIVRSLYLIPKWIIISALEFLAYRFYNRIILINNEMRKFFSKKTTYLVRNTVSKGFIDNVNRAEGKDRTLLCVGNIIERKQQLKLIGLFGQAKLADRGWKLQLVGNCVGDYGTAVKALSKKIPGVEIYQNIDNNQLMKFYQKASIFCLISSAESSPISIQEAMYARCKIIATDVGGVSELSSFSSKQEFALCSTDDQILKAMHEFDLNFITTPGRLTHNIVAMREESLDQLTNMFADTQSNVRQAI